MKYKLNYSFMAAGVLAAAGSIVLAIIENESWGWQFSTLCWIGITFLNVKQLEKYENEKKHSK